MMLIDFILTDDTTSNNITESSTDSEGKFLVAGNNPTDHNIITATLNVTTKKSPTITDKWKSGTKEQWKNYNLKVKTLWESQANRRRKKIHPNQSKPYLRTPATHG